MPHLPTPPETHVTLTDGTRRYTVALSELPRRLRRAIARTPAPQLRRRVLRWGATAVMIVGIATAPLGAGVAQANAPTPQTLGTRFPATFDLGSLTATSNPAGSTQNGGAAGDRAGTSVADAGDVNGDGFNDVIIGAPYADPNGTDSGAAYVVFGTATGIPDIADLSARFDLSEFRPGLARHGHPGHRRPVCPQRHERLCA